MEAASLYRQSAALTDRVFGTTSRLDLPRGNHWPALVTVSLAQANERLDAVRLLLEKNYWNSAVILSRSLFELAVNLTFIAKDIKQRLPLYLKHGGIPLTKEEAEHLRIELSEGHDVDIIPGYTWKRVKDMCEDLGSIWAQEYEKFYSYASVPTHAGSSTFGQDYRRLLDQAPPSDQERAMVLVTATTFHLRVARIVSETFPSQVAPEKITQLRKECQGLGKTLVSQQ